jgi:hypothetical protein
LKIVSEILPICLDIGSAEVSVNESNNQP